MGLIGKISSSFQKRKDRKQKTKRARQAERDLVDRYELKPDPKVKTRYWLDDERYITVNTKSGASIKAAKNILLEEEKKPKIRKGTKAQRTAAATSQPGGILDSLAGASVRASQYDFGGFSSSGRGPGGRERSPDYSSLMGAGPDYSSLMGSSGRTGRKKRKK